MPPGIDKAGAFLRAYRERTGLSREQLVRQLPEGVRITAQQLYRIENGHSRTQLITAYALAELLTDLLGEAITLDDLFPMPDEGAA